MEVWTRGQFPLVVVLVASRPHYQFLAAGVTDGHSTIQHPGEALIVNYSSEAHASTDSKPAVLNRLHTCLAAVNLTGYFRSEGHLSASERNVEYLFSALSKIIPRALGDSALKCHCWKVETEFRVKRQDERSRRFTSQSAHVSKMRSKEKFSVPFAAITGHIGPLPISLHSNFDHTNPNQYRYISELTNAFENYSSRIACLPRVFLAGFTKCGTTFLYNMISAHPLMVKPDRKEPKWWHTVPIMATYPNLTELFIARYFVHFEPLAATVLSGTKNALTIDATPGTMYKWPGVEEKITNICLLPTVIPEILPWSKFIVIMRNPPDLLYSAFWYSCTHRGGHVTLGEQLLGPRVFHERIVEKIGRFNYCLQSFAAEKCAYDVYAENRKGDLDRCGATRLGLALYFVHIKKWLSVVPREKFLFLRLEDLSSNTTRTMRQVWDFMGVPPSENYAQSLTKRQNLMHVQKIVDYKHDPRMAMWNSTRELLVKFFHPYNQKLAELMQDNKFLWEN